MSEQLYANNATTTISTGLNTSVTLITVASGTGALFPSPTAGQFFVATLVDAATGLFNEIVYVTARTGDAMTVIRAQEGTFPRNWLIGDTFANFWTAGSTTGFFQGQTYAGNPNGHLAGNAGVAGGTQGVVPDLVYDTVNSVIWVCTTTGTSGTAVWSTPVVAGVGYYCGVSTGTANAQSVTPPSSLTAVIAGTAISFDVGATLTNTGATTITIGSLGTFNVFKSGPSGPAALTGGEIVAGNIVNATYDGAQFQISSNPAAGAPITISSNTNLVAGGNYILNSQGGSFTATLPPTAGNATITLSDPGHYLGTFPVTLARNGGTGTIDGIASDLTLITPGIVLTTWCNPTGFDWNLN